EKSNTINLGGCYIDLSDIQENILSVLDNYTKSNKSILLTMNTSDDKYNQDIIVSKKSSHIGSSHCCIFALFK
ncbi:hypothetical protein F7D07_25020, partial [Escherichia coli]|nr:hypothetical protein [Escherichia coli]